MSSKKASNTFSPYFRLLEFIFNQKEGKLKLPQGNKNDQKTYKESSSERNDSFIPSVCGIDKNLISNFHAKNRLDCLDKENKLSSKKSLLGGKKI